jgi:hypothetical protein
MATPLWIGPGTLSLSRNVLAMRSIFRISTPWGQAYSQRPQSVHIQGNRESINSWSRPSAAMRTAFLGSMPSTPETGQPPAQVPHVKQTSAHSGATLSLLSFLLMVIGSINQPPLCAFEIFFGLKFFEFYLTCLKLKVNQ